MGTKERKEREKEARKQEILEAAKAVFFEKGFQNTTMDQIAEAAELSKGSLYLHFPSKEELYAWILVEGLQKLSQAFGHALQGVSEWDQKLRRLAMAYYGFYQENRHYFRILFFLQHGEISSKVSDHLFQTCLQEGLSCLHFIAAAVQEGIDAGEVERQDPMETAVVLWGAFNGIIMLYEEEEHRQFIPSSLDRLIEQGIEMVMKGLQKRS